MPRGLNPDEIWGGSNNDDDDDDEFLLAVQGLRPYVAPLLAKLITFVGFKIRVRQGRSWRRKITQLYFRSM